MARYKVQGPDGKVYVFEGPVGASAADVEAFAAATFGGQAKERQQRIAAQQAEDRKRYSPAAQSDGTVGGYLSAAGQNLLPAIGSGMTSVLRAVGGGRLAAAMGLPATKEEADRIDAPLLDAPGGTTGRVIGSAAPTLVAIPFTPAALPGAMAMGAGVGALATEGDLGDRALGAAGGAAGTALARAIPVAYRAAKGVARGLVEPLTAAGRDRVAGRVVQRFATGDALDQLVSGSAAGGRSVTGATPTLAEVTRDPGLAGLQRAIATMDPEAAAQLAARQAENNAARVATLRSVAGEGEAPVQSSVRALRRIQQGPTRAQAEGTRDAAARASYGQAFEEGIDPRVAQMMQPQVAALMERPSVQSAVANARALAAEEGLTLSNDTSVQGLHYMKQALDDAIETATRAGDMNRARLVGQTARDLSSVLDELSPAYQAARAEFRANSVPVNRQAVAQRLADSASTAVRDLSGNPRLRAQQFAKAMNDEGALIEAATGQRGASALDDLMTPTQGGRIRAVRDELELLANLDAAAAGPGSHTAKMLAGQNLVRQVAGPLGAPESFVQSSLGDTLSKLTDLGYRLTSAQDRIGSRVADALLDPETAAALVRNVRAFDAARAARPQTQLDLLLQRATPGAAGYASGQLASQ